MSKVSLDWRICWVQAEVPLCQTWRGFSAPAVTSDVSACLRTIFPPEEHWIFLESHCYFLLSFLQVLLWICFCSLSGGTGCSWSGAWPWEAVTNSGGSSWCEFPHPGAFWWPRSCGAQFGASVWWWTTEAHFEELPSHVPVLWVQESLFHPVCKSYLWQLIPAWLQLLARWHVMSFLSPVMQFGRKASMWLDFSLLGRNCTSEHLNWVALQR